MIIRLKCDAGAKYNFESTRMEEFWTTHFTVHPKAFHRPSFSYSSMQGCFLKSHYIKNKTARVTCMVLTELSNLQLLRLSKQNSIVSPIKPIRSEQLVFAETFDLQK
jgi:hypothetical protein